jgi:hypothetical protein
MRAMPAPHVRSGVGRHVRIPESALAEFIKAGTVEPMTVWSHRRSRVA